MRKALVSLLVVTTMVVGAQAAFAAVTTHLTIHWNATSERFHGKVRAGDDECLAGRTVKVFKKTANGPVLQGKTRSNANAGWHLSVMHAGGHYFAVTPAYDAMHATCAKDRSKTIDVM